MECISLQRFLAALAFSHRYFCFAHLSRSRPALAAAASLSQASASLLRSRSLLLKRALPVQKKKYTYIYIPILKQGLVDSAVLAGTGRISCFVRKDFHLSLFGPSPHSSLLVPPLPRLVTSLDVSELRLEPPIIPPVCCKLTHQMELFLLPSCPCATVLLRFRLLKTSTKRFISMAVVNRVAIRKVSNHRLLRAIGRSVGRSRWNGGTTGSRSG